MSSLLSEDSRIKKVQLSKIVTKARKQPIRISAQNKHQIRLPQHQQQQQQPQLTSSLFVPNADGRDVSEPLAKHSQELKKKRSQTVQLTSWSVWSASTLLGGAEPPPRFRHPKLLSSQNFLVDVFFFSFFLLHNIIFLFIFVNDFSVCFPLSVFGNIQRSESHIGYKAVITKHQFSKFQVTGWKDNKSAQSAQG